MGSTNRLLSLSGLAAVAMMFTSALLFDFYEYLPDPAEIQAHLTENDTIVWLAGYFGLIGMFFLLWFGSVLRSRLRSVETGDGMVTNVAFAGITAAAVLGGAAYSVMIASGARAGADGGISDTMATFAYDIYGTILGTGIAVALGAAIAAFAVVSSRTRLMPAWFTWVSAIIAIGVISPLSYLFIALAVLWVAYVSVALWWADKDDTAMAPG